MLLAKPSSISPPAENCFCTRSEVSVTSVPNNSELTSEPPARSCPRWVKIRSELPKNCTSKRKPLGTDVEGREVDRFDLRRDSRVEWTCARQTAPFMLSLSAPSSVISL